MVRTSGKEPGPGAGVPGDSPAFSPEQNYSVPSLEKQGV